MKKYLFLLLLLNFHIASAQIQSGEIIYKIKAPNNINNFMDTTEVEEPAIKDFMKKEFDKIKKHTPYLTFNLQFNNKESVFHYQNNMSNDSGVDLNLIAIVTGVDGLYYTSLRDQTNLHQFESFDKKWLIQKDLSDINWEIQNESKVIKGYKCKKAVAKVNFNHLKKGTITAWFCPDLPYPYGPMEYNGLPGIILGLEIRNFYFYADSIKLNPNSIKLNKPVKGKLATEKEYFEAAADYGPWDN